MKSSTEIKAEIAALEAQFQKLGNDLSEKRRALIIALENESDVKIGDMVVLTESKKTGIFGGFRQKYNRIEPILYKPKKDGTASKFEVWFAYGDKMQKAQ